MCKKPFVIGIAGAVGAGKSWFAEKLKESLSVPVCVFTLDTYSKEEYFVNNLEYHYDNPQAIDYDKAYADFSKLMQGIPVNLPVYDYSFHSVLSEKTYDSSSVIIVEGLYAFYDKRFLDSTDFKIWIEADERTCLERRIQRDLNERGETREESMYRHFNDSVPAYRLYYEQGAKMADCVYLNLKNNVEPQLVKILNKCVLWQTI